MTDALYTRLLQTNDDRRTGTVKLLTTAAKSIYDNAITFTFLALLLLSLRTFLETASHHITSFIDTDPFLKSVLSPVQPPTAKTHHLTHRRPFLHLTRVGTLDDDFFSGDESDPDRTLFGVRPGPPPNGTLLLLYPGAGFSGRVFDNGVRVEQLAGKPGFGFKVLEERKIVDSDGDGDGDDDNKGVDFEFFVKGFKFGSHDAVMLLSLVTFLMAAYGWIVIVFLLTYGCVLGVVFVCIVNDLLGRFCSFFGLFLDGRKLGMKRLPGFILMRWAVRDAVTQLLGLWYFGEIEDQYSFFKLFVRLKLLPFLNMMPWIRGLEKEISGFLFIWFLVDVIVALVFAVCAWVAIVDTRRTGREIVKEGFYLLSMLKSEAFRLKCLEFICCGSLLRWALARVCGNVFAAVFQSAAEVYFMAAWLVFYLAARCKDAVLHGQRFGQREMEGFLEGLR